MGILWMLGAVVLVTALAVATTRYALQRRNRVVAGVPSPAPLGWLSSGRREAKLHRRLRASGRRLALVAPADDVDDIVVRLRVELVELDAHLVTVARRPSRVRRADRPQLVERVEQIEELVRRIEDRARAEPTSLDDLGERLDLLEAADRELDELGPPG